MQSQLHSLIPPLLPTPLNMTSPIVFLPACMLCLLIRSRLPRLLSVLVNSCCCCQCHCCCCLLLLLLLLPRVVVIVGWLRVCCCFCLCWNYVVSAVDVVEPKIRLAGELKLHLCGELGCNVVCCGEQGREEVSSGVFGVRRGVLWWR